MRGKLSSMTISTLDIQGNKIFSFRLTKRKEAKDPIFIMIWRFWMKVA